jgi:hypothetical protein
MYDVEVNGKRETLVTQESCALREMTGELRA